MNLTDLAEKGWLPDWLIRIGIRRQLRARLEQERRHGDASRHTADLVGFLKESPIALATDQANAQHYDVPPQFFEAVLGPRLKYSCCLYPDRHTSLREAEERMLRLTCQRAEIEDGMEVLDLGCGWGALTLWIAEHYPRCRVTALSNSAQQKRCIETRARERGLGNVRVVTANIVEYAGDHAHDRVVSIEMFEHMRNLQTLLARIAAWLRPAGKLFVHIFCHRESAYTFDSTGGNDWMARHFFTDGLMPSFDLLAHFDRDLVISRCWQVNGRHYARTCEDWLLNLNAKRARLLALFGGDSDPATARVTLQRWRMFFMACAELFRHGGGTEWFVGHYLLEPRAVATTSGPQLLGSERHDHSQEERSGDMSLLELIAVNLSVTALFMVLVWLMSLKLRDVSIVDVFWGMGFVAIAAVTFFLTGEVSSRKIVLLTLTSVWGLRLAAHLARRKLGTPEDHRYQAMRQAIGPRFWLVSLFTVFALQGLIMNVVALPIVAGQLDRAPLDVWAFLGMGLWTVGFLFETIGDYQLARFKSDPGNRGKVMDRGLWRYTRHPNYFGDFLIWWGIYLAALGDGHAWWTIIGPLVMSFLLLRVSGVTLLERSLQQTKEGYAEYMARTSAFFPWWRRDPGVALTHSSASRNLQ